MRAPGVGSVNGERTLHAQDSGVHRIRWRDNARSGFATFAVTILALLPSISAAQGLDIDQLIDDTVAPLAEFVSSVIFYSVPVLGADVPLIVVWLIAGALYFTLSFGFINVRGFPHALKVVRGDYAKASHPGEVTHFQALATAVSGTVGIGNIGGVAVAIAAGGPGAVFWMIVAGMLGMSTKFVECALGTMYRRTHADGTVSGGPMYYLERGLAECNLPRLGNAMAKFYAIGLVIGCLGIGNMFQSNQAYIQFVSVTGGQDASWFSDKGWLFGILIAAIVALVIVGGIKSIGRVTEKMVPFMAVLYCIGAVTIITFNYEALPYAISAIFTQAFNPESLSGGAIGVMIIGFQRAVFSNEAGIGSAAVAHSAAQTKEPIAEGYVALLEPFIDTIVICTLTALVIITASYYDPGITRIPDGIAMTSGAFERSVSWSPYAVAFAGFLFAITTAISWSYYGLKGWTYLVGKSTWADYSFKTVFCLFLIVGCSIQLESVLSFSDALVFVICVPNILGLLILTPTLKRRLAGYDQRVTDGKIVDQSLATESRTS